jgi:hypothetical protein
MQRYASESFVALSLRARHAYEELCDVMQQMIAARRYAELPSIQSRATGSRSIKTFVSPRDLNRLFREELSRLGWRCEYPIDHGRMAVDFYKDGVIAEVQFGKDVYTAENLHCKFKLAMDKNPTDVEAAVLIVPTQDMCRRMSKGIGSFEFVMRNYVTPAVMNRNLDYPLAVVGVGCSS